MITFRNQLSLFLFVPASDEEDRAGYPEDEGGGGDGSPEELCGQWAPWQPLWIQCEWLVEVTPVLLPVQIDEADEYQVLLPAHRDTGGYWLLVPGLHLGYVHLHHLQLRAVALSRTWNNFFWFTFW